MYENLDDKYMAAMLANSEAYSRVELYIEALRVNANEADQLLWSIVG